MSSFDPYEGAKTHSPSIVLVNCTLLKAVPNVVQFLNFMNLWLIHLLLEKAVN